MSDSLRDQLMKAGFKENPASKKNKQTRNQAGKVNAGKNNKEPSNNKHAQKKRGGSQHQGASAFATEKQRLARSELEKAEAARVAEKKAVKLQIKTLIEAHCIKDHSGTVAYSYLLGTRVKQLFVKEEFQKKLAAGELLITRLNGSTFLVPPETGAQIITLNPEWALVGGDHNSAGAAEEDGEYAEYQIPDDLTW